MPTPKGVSSYPLEYFDLFRKAISERVDVALPSKKDAHFLRLQLYGFRAALIQDPTADQELALLSSGLIMKVEALETGARLSIETRERDEALKAIRDVL